MDTLVSLRNLEPILELEGLVDDKSKTAYVTEQVLKRNGAVLVFVNHSDDIVNIVLSEIDPMDSGYVFFASELQVDPINNCMVPTHRLATPKEIQSLTDRCIPHNKLPIIRMLDPIRRWYNFPLGSIVAIERNSPDGSRSVYFRRVALH